MATGKDILLIDCGRRSMGPLRTRLCELGYRVVPTKTPEGARDALVDPRYLIGAAVIPPDLPVADLGSALAALRDLATDGILSFLATGDPPEPEERLELRDAGVELALWEPVDDHVLRFQLNRALAGNPRVQRRSVRAPVDWPVRVRAAGREKPARIYSLSASGAFIETPRPSLPNALVHVTLPLPSGPLNAAARVVMTNVPGNLQRENLPLGMGLRFTGNSPEAEQAIREHAEEVFRALQI